MPVGWSADCRAQNQYDAGQAFVYAARASGIIGGQSTPERLLAGRTSDLLRRALSDLLRRELLDNLRGLPDLLRQWLRGRTGGRTQSLCDVITMRWGRDMILLQPMSQ